MRFGVVIFALLGFLFVSGDSPNGQIPAEMRVKLGSICKHYVNRARFMARSPEQPFVVTLADACTAAQTSLDSVSHDERLAAVGFLTQLRVFRDTVIDMNMTRVFGETYTPYTRMKYGNKARSESVRKVSGTGEYLIAYRMGLLKAYQAWLDTGPQMALVSEKGPNP